MLPVQQFVNFVNQHQLFDAEDHILLAVSGGKDSVLMAHLFKLAKFNFSIAHCNFNLRGDEALRDEAFTKLLASTLNVAFHVTHFDTKSYATEHQISTQMAARTLRYEWFEQLRSTKNYSYIALAQHQNDALETVLLNLVRGTGISGLHGILPKRNYLIRPLLFLSGDEISELAETNNIAYVEDSSNLTDKYARNNIRLNVVPHLKEINPNLAQTFVANIQRFAETEEVLQAVVQAKKIELFNFSHHFITIAKQQVIDLQPQKLLFFELLRPYNFTATVVDEILNSLHALSGTSFYSKTHRVTINRDELLLSDLSEHDDLVFQYIHLNDAMVALNQHKISIKIHTPSDFNKHLNIAQVDFDRLIFPLVLRFKQNGDKFMPLGMTKSKKLSDFFIQQKVPLPQKPHIPLIVNGNGEIIWVAGMRQDERYKVTATTKKVIIFELLNN